MRAAFGWHCRATLSHMSLLWSVDSQHRAAQDSTALQCAAVRLYFCPCAAAPYRDTAQRVNQPVGFWWQDSQYPESHPWTTRMLRLCLHDSDAAHCHACAAAAHKDPAQRPHQPISFWWHGSEYPEPNPDHEDAQTVFALMPHAHRQDSSWAQVECERLKEVVLQLARVSGHNLSVEKMLFLDGVIRVYHVSSSDLVHAFRGTICSHTSPLGEAALEGTHFEGTTCAASHLGWLGLSRPLWVLAWALLVSSITGGACTAEVLPQSQT